MTARILNLSTARLDRIATRINAAHAKAEAASATVVQCAVEAGHLLLEAKEVMPHGEFGPWLDENISVARQTARHYMRLAKAYEHMSKAKRSHVSVLPLREALRVIAGPTDANPANWPAASEQWFTPTEIVERARKVMGCIDLDPASCREAQKAVKANRYFSASKDGLARPWRGTIFLNPPFTREKITRFVDKLIAEYSCGHVSAAILLTNGYTDKQWFHDIAANAAAICFTRNRIKFVRPNGEESHPPYGQALAYFGKNVARFKRHFADVGFIVVPHK